MFTHTHTSGRTGSWMPTMPSSTRSVTTSSSSSQSTAACSGKSLQRQKPHLTQPSPNPQPISSPIGQSNGAQSLARHDLHHSGDNLPVVCRNERTGIASNFHDGIAFAEYNLCSSFSQEAVATTRQRQDGRHALASRIESEHFRKTLHRMILTNFFIVKTCTNTLSL